MGNQKENNDELLFGLLSEKLYSHYCGTKEEHLSKEEEQAVINMMNSLQVEENDDFNPSSAYQRFCHKYLSDQEVVAKPKTFSSVEELVAEMEEDLKDMKAPEKPWAMLIDLWAVLCRLGRRRGVRRLALAILIITVMFFGMNIGTYATAKMGFVEFLSKNDKGWSFMVTGEDNSVEMDEIEQNMYKSWDEVKLLDGMEGVLFPNWIPEGCDLGGIWILQGPDKTNIDGKYYMNGEEKFQIIVEKYTKEIGWQYFVREAQDKYIENIIGEKRVLWHQDEEKTVCFWVEGKYSYYVCGYIGIDEMKIIVENIK